MSVCEDGQRRIRGFFLAIMTAQAVRKTKRRPRASLVIDPTFCLEFIVIASLAKY